MTPGIDEVSVGPGAAEVRRQAIFDHGDEPGIFFEQARASLLQRLRGGHGAERFGRLIEEGDPSPGIHHDHAVFQAGEDIFPRNRGGVAFFGIVLHGLGVCENGRIITDRARQASVLPAARRPCIAGYGCDKNKLHFPEKKWALPAFLFWGHHER